MKKNQVFTVVLCLFLLVFSKHNVFAQKSFQLPTYEKFKLSNGLTVYLMEQHEVPVINVSTIIPAGAIYDKDQKGLASLTANNLLFGTKNLSKSQIEEELDFLGASINTYANKEFAALTANFAAKDQDKVLKIIKEVLTKPVFNEIEFEKEKTKVLKDLERDKESPRAVIGNYWDKFMYGNHPYGNPVSGEISSIKNLNAADVKEFYKKNYGPSASAIAIVGDFNSKAMKAKITKMMNSWTKNASPADDLNIPFPDLNKSRVLLVNKEDARETTLLIGAKGVSRNNPDYEAIELVNTVLGGRFTSWLNDELRVNSGLTYGANSRFVSLKNNGTFYVSTFTANATTKPTIDKALEVLKKLNDIGLDGNTLISAKNYVNGQFPPRYETSGQLAGFLTQMFWYNLNDSYINNFVNKISSLTLEDTKKIISKYYTFPNLQFVLIGKSEDIKNIAKEYGEVIEKEIKSDSF
jgi:zinc protease